MKNPPHFNLYIYQDDWRISIAQGNGFIYISISYTGKLYVSILLSYIICRLKYKLSHWLKGLLFIICNGDFLFLVKAKLLFFFLRKEIFNSIWVHVMLVFEGTFWPGCDKADKKYFAFIKTVHFYLIFGIVIWLIFSYPFAISSQCIMLGKIHDFGE